MLSQLTTSFRARVKATQIDQGIANFVDTYVLGKRNRRSGDGTPRLLTTPQKQLVTHVWEKNVRFAAAAATAESIPPAESNDVEIAFAGRSNVGKSSLLNCLANSFGARTARVSEKPGETKQVTFFHVGKLFRVVDLPGYGFAFAGASDAEKMSSVMRTYLQERKALKHIVLLIDARHGFKVSDTEMATWLQQNCKAKLHICLTKCDAVEPNQLKRIATMVKEDARQFTKEQVLLVSGLKKQGIDVLRRDIVRFAVPSLYRKLILRFQRRDDIALGKIDLNDIQNDDGDADAAVAADDAEHERLMASPKRVYDNSAPGGYRTRTPSADEFDDEADDDAGFEQMMATQKHEQTSGPSDDDGLRHRLGNRDQGYDRSDDNERPGRSYNGRGRGDERPRQRSFSERPRDGRSFSERPTRGADSRPARSFDRTRDFGGERQNRDRDSDRPARNFDRSRSLDRPRDSDFGGDRRQSFGNGPQRSFDRSSSGGDPPQRSFDRSSSFGRSRSADAPRNRAYSRREEDDQSRSTRPPRGFHSANESRSASDVRLARSAYRERQSLAKSRK